MTAPLRWQATPHAGYFINALGISADGRKTVAGTFFHSYSDERRTSADSNTGNFGIYCWDSSGALQWSNTFTGYEGVYWASLSADGSYAASGGWYSSTPTYSGFIAAFDAATGAPVLDYYKTPTRVNQVVLNSDGSVLAAGGDQLYLFFRSGAQFSTTPSTLPVASGDSVISIGISADGQWVAAGTYAGTVLLVKIVGGVPVSSNTWSPAATNTVHSVAMATNGQGFAVGMKNGEFLYFACDDFLSNAQPAWTQILTGASSVYGVAIAADASFVSAVGNIGSASGTVGVFDNTGSAATLRWQQTLTANPNSTSIDSEGLFVAVADGHPDGTPGHFTLFNANSSAQIWSCTTGNMSWPIQVASNAMACVGGSDDGSVYYFNPLRVL